MSGPDDLPEPDCVAGAAHPRQTAHLLGQAEAEAAFLNAYGNGRLHHAWLITGPRGVGKATLAWRIARFLLAVPTLGQGGGLFDDTAVAAPASLDIPPDHPAVRRVAALSEPRLCLIRRAWDPERKRLRSVITVDEIRRLRAFFGLTSADGGHRVVIVDAADEMNANAANALLKQLEEPPKGAVMLLVSHQPSRLLPTIRSRCRDLRCAGLNAANMAAAMAAAGADPGPNAAALAELSGGSVGAALRLANLDGLQLYGSLARILASLPRLDRPLAISLADRAAGRGAEDRFDLMIGLIDLALARLARAGIAGPPPAEAAEGEARILARLSPSPAAGRAWAEAQQTLGARLRQGRAVNLDPAALILDTMLKINDTAARLAAGEAR